MATFWERAAAMGFGSDCCSSWSMLTCYFFQEVAQFTSYALNLMVSFTARTFCKLPETLLWNSTSKPSFPDPEQKQSNTPVFRVPD